MGIRGSTSLPSLILWVKIDGVEHVSELALVFVNALHLHRQNIMFTSRSTPWESA